MDPGPAYGSAPLLYALALLALPTFARHSNALAQSAPSAQLGISAIAALGFNAGIAELERAAEGHDFGTVIDLGWMRTPQLRLQAEVDFLRANLTERIEVEDTTYKGVFYDLTTSLSAVALLGSRTQRLVPYISAGFGVHALSSAFRSRVIDRRYNANPFGVHVGAGFRLWLPGSGRYGVSAEVRRVIADNVDRTSVRGGILFFYRDLVRRSRR